MVASPPTAASLILTKIMSRAYVINVPDGYELVPVYELRDRRVQLIWTQSLYDRVKKNAHRNGTTVNDYVHCILEKVVPD